MGGSTYTYWRGNRVSPDMVDPLNELAAAVGPRVTPIPGYGSYADNAASSDIDEGGGHIDIYAGDAYGWTEAERLKFVLKAREVGFECFCRYKRWWSPVRQQWQTATWATHFHLLKKDTADMSSAAKGQLYWWYQGTNGMAGFWWNGERRHDPDPYSRVHLKQTWTQYLIKKAADAGISVITPEDDMPLNDTDKAWFRTAIRDEVENFFESERSNQLIFQTHETFKNLGALDPNVAPRVSASYVMENGMLDRRINRDGDNDKTALQELADVLTATTAQGGQLADIEGLTHEQDDLLRTILSRVEELGKAAGA